MLVLSRKDGQKVFVGDKVVITVLEIRGETVRLGFDAPSDISIHREEVSRRIADERAPPSNDRSTCESRFFAEFA